MVLLYNELMGIDKALEKRRKAIQQEQITHRAILEPELTKANETKQPRKRVKDGIRNKNKR